MKLRVKAWLIFVAVFAALIVGVQHLLDATVLAGFSRFEEHAVERDMERLLRLVEAEIGHLETIAVDWAEWDDSYEYMGTPSPAFEAANLGEDTFRTLGLSLLAYVRPSGEVVFGRVYNRTTKTLEPLPEGLGDVLAREATEGHLDAASSGVRGMCLFSGSTHLVAARRILRSDAGGTSRGLLVMCRPFDRDMLDHLARSLDLRVSMHEPTGDPATTGHRHPALLSDLSSHVRVLPPEPESITAEADLADIHGVPVLGLQVTSPRTISEQGHAVTHLVAISMLVSLFASGLVVQLLLDRGVLARLATLDSELLHVTTTRDLSIRVPVRGGDEVAHLAAGINAMLGALERSEATLRESEERYRAIVEEQTELICRWRPDGTLVFVNQAFEEITGESNEQLLGRSFPALLSDLPAGVTAALAALSPTVPTGAFVGTLVDADGTRHWIQWNTRALFSASGSVVELQSVGRDITEQRGLAEALREAERQGDATLGGPAELALLCDPGGAVLAANDATATRIEHFGARIEGLHVQDLFGADAAAQWRANADEALRKRAAVRWDADVKGRTFDLLVVPVGDGSARSERLAMFGRDVTDQRRAEAAERRLAAAARRRGALESVARDLETLQSSGRQILERLAEVTATELGCLCVIHLLSPDGERLMPVTLSSSLLSGRELLGRGRRLRARPCGRGPVCDAIAAMDSLPLVDSRARTALTSYLPELEAHFAAIPHLHARLTPVVLAGRAAGLLTAVRESGTGPFPTEDQEFLDEIAARAALAIGQVKLHDELQGELRERARVEDALRDAREVFLQISRSLRGVLWIREAAGSRITYVSPGWEHVWGRSTDDLYRDSVNLLAGIHPDDRPSVAQELTAARPTPDCVLEFRVVRPDGTVRSVVARQVHLAGVEPGQDKVFAMAEDITERRAIEEQSRRLDAQLRLLARRLDGAREEERRKLAVWIHDEIGQMLTALRLDLAWIRRRLPHPESEVVAALDEMQELLDQKVSAVQQVATELRPTILDDLGLPAAIEWELERFAQRTGLRATVAAAPAAVRARPEVAHAVFQVLKEALTNVARHARASRVQVGIEVTDEGTLVFTVTDDGRGLRPEQAAGPGSLGILGMRERISVVGGSLDVAGADGTGTTLTARIPQACASPNGASGSCSSTTTPS